LRVGIDMVRIVEIREAVERHGDAYLERVFTPGEVAYCRSRGAGLADSLAARFAAKEAVAKALDAPVGLRWHDCEVRTEPSGRPVLELTGSVAAAADAAGITHWHLSLSHDAGIASAMVVAERRV